MKFLDRVLQRGGSQKRDRLFRLAPGAGHWQQRRRTVSKIDGRYAMAWALIRRNSKQGQRSVPLIAGLFPEYAVGGTVRRHYAAGGRGTFSSISMDEAEPGLLSPVKTGGCW